VAPTFDLVRDSRPKTFFPLDPRQSEVIILTAHVFEESGTNPHERVDRRKEVWKRERRVRERVAGEMRKWQQSRGNTRGEANYAVADADRL
jgi:hypothetical protein